MSTQVTYKPHYAFAIGFVGDTARRMKITAGKRYRESAHASPAFVDLSGVISAGDRALILSLYADFFGAFKREAYELFVIDRTPVHNGDHRSAAEVADLL